MSMPPPGVGGPTIHEPSTDPVDPATSTAGTTTVAEVNTTMGSAWSTATARMRRFLDDIDARADHTQDGWNRNSSTLSWLPFFAFAVLIVYFVRGNRMTVTTRAHVIRAINLSVTTILAFLVYFVIALVGNGVRNDVAFDSLDGSRRTDGGSPVLGFFLFLLVAVVMFLFGLFLDARGATSPLRWAMIGIWLLFCLIAVFSADSVTVGTAFAYVFLFVVLVTNAFRGRIGLRPSTLGIPNVPLFSER